MPLVELDQIWSRYLSSGNPHDENTLVTHYLYVGEQVVRSMRGGFHDHANLTSLAGEGVLDGIRRWRPGHTASPETYIRHRARGVVLDGLRNIDHLTRTQRRQLNKLYRLATKLSKDVFLLTVDEVSRHLKVTTAIAERILLLLPAAIVESLEDLSNDSSWEKRLASGEAIVQSDAPWDGFDTDKLAELLEILKPKQRYVVDRIYHGGITYKEIADELGLSESRVCQLHDSALETLQQVGAELGYWGEEYEDDGLGRG